MRIDAASPMVRALIVALPEVARSIRVATPDAAPPPPATAGALAAATSVQMLVALSAAEPAIERRRRLAADADRGLRQLESLHRELLQGVPAPDRLRELGDWVETLLPPEDPVLAEVAREIEVRVRVELAKHELLA